MNRPQSRSCSGPDEIRNKQKVIGTYEQIEQKPMNEIRLAIGRAKDAVEELIRFNHAPIIEETQILSKISKLGESFLPFHREALKNSSQQLVSTRSAALSFFEHWKTTVSALEMIKTQGIESLQSLIAKKFECVMQIINKLDSIDKSMLHYELVHNCCENLRTVLTETSKEISTINAKTDFFPENENHYISLVRNYLKVYNNGFYSVFPRSGMMPMELAGMKSETLTLCNDVITALRSIFSFNTDLSKIYVNIEDIDRWVKEVSQTLNITLISVAPKIEKRAPQKRAQKSSGKLSPSQSIQNTRLEKFLASLMNAIDEIVPDPSMHLNDRLARVEEAVLARLENNDFGAQAATSSHSKNLLEMVRDARDREKETVSRFQTEKAILERDLEEATAKVKDLEEKLVNIRDYYASGKKEEAYEKMGERLASMMDPVDQIISSQVEKMEKMNLFVVERRCARCRELEEETRAIRKTISKFVDIKPGESLSSAVEVLVHKYESTQSQLVQLTAIDKEHSVKLEKLEVASNEIVDSITEQLRARGIEVNNNQSEDVQTKLLETFDQLMSEHKEELENRAVDLQEKHTNDMNDIASVVLEMFPEMEQVTEEAHKDVDLPTLVKQQLSNAQQKVDEMKTALKDDEEVLRQMREWVQIQVADCDITDMSMADAFSMMVKSLEKAENPLTPIIEDLRMKEEQAENDLRAVLVTARNDGLIPKNRNIYKMNMSDLLLAVKEYQERVTARILAQNRELDTHRVQSEENRKSLESLGCKIRRLMRRDDVVLEGQDTNELWFRITSLVDELVSGGTRGHFVSVADINDMTRTTRKLTQMQGTADPRQYLPALMQMLDEDHQSVTAASKFTDPLDAILKGFDLQNATLSLESESFKFIREKIFQMHLLLGNESNRIPSESLYRVFERFVGLCSTFLSHMAAVFMNTK